MNINMIVIIRTTSSIPSINIVRQSTSIPASRLTGYGGVLPTAAVGGVVLFYYICETGINLFWN
jgi:hypothetical protein